MNNTDKKLKTLFQSAKKANQTHPELAVEPPLGFSTRVVSRYLNQESDPVVGWSWEGFALKGGVCAVIISGFIFWEAQKDWDAYADHYLEARLIETAIDQEIL